MPETHAHEEDFDSDDEICLTEILEKLKKTEDVAPIEEVLCLIFFVLFCVFFFCEIACVASFVGLPHMWQIGKFHHK